MWNKITQAYREGGLRRVATATWRRLVSGPPRPHPVHEVVDAIVKQPEFTVVQLGAFVGNTPNDPLYARLRPRLDQQGGRLICVEPVKEHFSKLVENYRGSKNVFCENVAIADRTGEATFYRLGVDPVEHGYPDWLSQLGSLKSDRMGSLWDRFEKDPALKAFYLQHRVEETVTCLTFAELLRRHGVARVDLLQMDVEGYELEILSTIDFGQTPIRFINYESVLLHERKKEAESLMERAGYGFFDHGQDTFCYRTDEPNRFWS
jgi:FkbM family methyltransferase